LDLPWIPLLWYDLILQKILIELSNAVEHEWNGRGQWISTQSGILCAIALILCEQWFEDRGVSQTHADYDDLGLSHNLYPEKHDQFMLCSTLWNDPKA
jgi:hypothetical protein